MRLGCIRPIISQHDHATCQGDGYKIRSTCQSLPSDKRHGRGSTLRHSICRSGRWREIPVFHVFGDRDVGRLPGPVQAAGERDDAHGARRGGAANATPAVGLRDAGCDARVVCRDVRRPCRVRQRPGLSAAAGKHDLGAAGWIAPGAAGAGRQRPVGTSDDSQGQKDRWKNLPGEAGRYIVPDCPGSLRQRGKVAADRRAQSRSHPGQPQGRTKTSDALARNGLRRQHQPSRPDMDVRAMLFSRVKGAADGGDPRLGALNFGEASGGEAGRLREVVQLSGGGEGGGGPSPGKPPTKKAPLALADGAFMALLTPLTFIGKDFN